MNYRPDEISPSCWQEDRKYKRNEKYMQEVQEAIWMYCTVGEGYGYHNKEIVCASSQPRFEEACRTYGNGVPAFFSFSMDCERYGTQTTKNWPRCISPSCSDDENMKFMDHHDYTMPKKFEYTHDVTASEGTHSVHGCNAFGFQLCEQYTCSGIDTSDASFVYSAPKSTDRSACLDLYSSETINPCNAADHWSFIPLNLENLTHPFFLIQIIIAGICSVLIAVAKLKQKEIRPSEARIKEEDSGSVSTHPNDITDQPEDENIGETSGDCNKEKEGDEEIGKEEMTSDVEQDEDGGRPQLVRLFTLVALKNMDVSLGVQVGSKLTTIANQMARDYFGLSDESSFGIVEFKEELRRSGILTKGCLERGDLFEGELLEAVEQLRSSAYGEEKGFQDIDIHVCDTFVLDTMTDMDRWHPGQWALYKTVCCVSKVSGSILRNKSIKCAWKEAIRDGTLLSELKTDGPVIGIGMVTTDIKKRYLGEDEEEEEEEEEDDAVEEIGEDAAASSPTPPKELSEDDRLRRWQIKICLVQFCSMLVATFAVMVGRFIVLWSISSHYTPMSDDKSLAYINIDAYLHDSPSKEELEELGCPPLVMSSFEKVSTEYFGGLYAFFRLSPEMAMSVFAAISMVLGLVIFLILEGLVAWFDIKLERRMFLLKKKKYNGGPLGNRLCRLLLFGIVSFIADYVLFQLIRSQQSVVLMPLNEVTPTPYCLVISSPPGLPVDTLIRLFIYSICAIPIGLPVILVSLLIIRCTMLGGPSDYADVARNSPAFRRDASCCERFCGGADLCCGCCMLLTMHPGIVCSYLPIALGLGLIAIWLFAGCGFGVWVNFYSKFIDFSQTTTVLADTLAPALFLVGGVMDEFTTFEPSTMEYPTPTGE